MVNAGMCYAHDDSLKELRIICMFQKKIAGLSDQNVLLKYVFNIIRQFFNDKVVALYSNRENNNKPIKTLQQKADFYLCYGKNVLDVDARIFEKVICIKKYAKFGENPVKHVFPILELDSVKAILIISDADLSEKEILLLETLCYQTSFKMQSIGMKKLNENSQSKIKMLEETVQMNELRSEYFVNLSHDFRTPLNILLTSLQLIHVRPENIYKYVNTMKQNIYRLMRMINNLIDITKIDTGFFRLNIVNCDIINFIEEITFSITHILKDKGIDLIFDTQLEEKTIAFDLDCIERVMLNLLSNAAKFTDTGGIIRVNIFEENNYIVVTVTDTGKGIPPEKLPAIFDRFTQIKCRENRSGEGFGIGLSLVKSMINLHNGDIKVKSQPGIGSEFRIELPDVRKIEKNNEDSTYKYMNSAKIDYCRIEFSDIYKMN